MIKNKYFAATLANMTLLVCLISGSSIVFSGSQERPYDVRFPLKIGGISTVFLKTEKDASSQNALNAGIFLYYGSNPAEHLWVSIDKLNLREARPGSYVGQEDGSAVYANRLVKIAIRALPAPPYKPSAEVKEPKPLATGQARLTDIVEIVSPTRLETFNLKTASITIRWRFTSGAGPISRVAVIEGVGGALLFEQLNVPGESLSINTSIFRPGRQYSIWLIKDNPDFTLAGDVASSSRLMLKFQTFVPFNTR